MKLSCDPILFFRDMVLDKTMSQAQWYDMARELGLDGTKGIAGLRRAIAFVRRTWAEVAARRRQEVHA